MALAAGITTVTLAVSGCKSPGEYRRQADDVSYSIIQSKQQAALGKTEPFTIEQPADTLRRRLMLDQYLPYSDEASLGTKSIDPIEQWPKKEDYLKAEDEQADVEVLEGESDELIEISDVDETAPIEPLKLSLIESLKVAARSSRAYQDQKERVFLAALSLDLERDSFRNTWSGVLESLFSADASGDDTVVGVENFGRLDVARRFKNGASVVTGIGIDLVSLLSPNDEFARGMVADASISIPLMRGSGEFVVTEPLTQAERDVVYAIYSFERFKRVFAVDVASEYLSVLQQIDQVENASGNYRRLIASTRRARALADKGRLPEIQIDQALQDELSARDRWIGAQQSYETALDRFKITLGLPTDALIELDREEMSRMAAGAQALVKKDEQEVETDVLLSADAPVDLPPPDMANAGPYELPLNEATLTALENRLDLRISIGRVFDSQRDVVVSADRLRADLTLLGATSFGQRRSLGSAGADDGEIEFDQGRYSALIGLDLPLERTAERNAYRQSLIGLEQSVRDVQDLEDSIKLDIRALLRELLESREGVRIQALAVQVAERRVTSTKLFLETGREGVQIRDVLEAEDDLLSAQNALTSALLQYRTAEWRMQRDLGVLSVDETGMWREYDPTEFQSTQSTQSRGKESEGMNHG